MARNGVLRLDAALYLGSAILAGLVAWTTELATFRIWAAFALPSYLSGAIAALCVLHWDLAKLHVGRAIRIGIAVFTFGTAVVAPLAYEVHLRAADHPRMAQAEVHVIEQAAARLTTGRDPYTGLYLETGLESRPGAQRYFAYLPFMLAFGLPYALLGPSPLSDARISMTVVALAALAAALALWRTTEARRIRLAQVTIVLPGGALFLVSGGDDAVVLALLLLAIVLLERGSSWSWPVLIGCAFLKQTAWPVILVAAVLAARNRRVLPSLRARPVPAVAVAGAGLVATIPLALWQPVAFLRAVALFPLGLTSGPSFDQAPTLGSWLMTAVTAHGSKAAAAGLAALLLCSVLVTAVAVLVRLADRPFSVADLAIVAGLLLLALVLSAPISRPGYLVYPMCLLTLGALMRERPPSLAPAARYVRLLSAEYGPARPVLRQHDQSLDAPALGHSRSQLMEEHDVG